MPRVGRVVRRLKDLAGMGDGPAVLLYHRVASLPTDPWSLAVPPEMFERQLDALRRRGPILPLDELVPLARAGKAPSRAVAITFDDGYADNLTTALPLLELYTAPATFFLVSRLLDDQRELWWDALQRIFLAPGTLPAQLAIAGAGDPWTLALDDAAVLTPSDAADTARWCAGQEPPTPRHRIFLEVWQRLRDLDPARRDAAVAELHEWAGVDAAPRESYRLMTPMEVRALAGSAVTSIGAHTVDHPRLASLPANEQRHQIAGSITALADWIEKPVTAFAYPHGQPADYNHDSLAAAAAAGVAIACTTRAGRISRRTHALELPRHYVTGELRL